MSQSNDTIKKTTICIYRDRTVNNVKPVCEHAKTNMELQFGGGYYNKLCFGPKLCKICSQIVPGPNAQKTYTCQSTNVVYKISFAYGYGLMNHYIGKDNTRFQ